MDNNEQEYIGTFHPIEKFDKMLGQMFGHRDPFRLVYRWVITRELTFRDFNELMTTYQRATCN